MTEDSWAAGFIDGEGSIGLYATGRGRNFIPCVRASGVDPAPLYRLQERFGGKITRKGTRGPRERQAYDWNLHGVPKIEDHVMKFYK